MTIPDDVSRPRLAVIVHNGITGDSRVVKTAIAAARGGWDVLLLGWARDRRRRESAMGPIKVIRAPLTRTLHNRFEAALAAERAASDRAYATPMRRLTGRVRHLGHRSLAPSAPPVLRPDTAPDDIVWRRDWPVFDDWWLSYEPELRAFRPDVIHANDVQMIGVAARYAAHRGLHGLPCPWVYDAHEFVAAVDWGGESVSAAYRQHEAEFIGQASAVVTISPVMAAMLHESQRLSTLPTVVANAPVAEQVPSPVDLRAICGLGPEVPLLVYSGLVAPGRGLDVAVRGLARLPGVHLALVAGGTDSNFQTLLDIAAEIGVSDRLHRTSYVPPAAVPAHLSVADVGLAPFHYSANYVSSLPTKVPEYLHARLPIVASDMAFMADFLAKTGVGETFASGSVDGFVAATAKVLEHRDAMRARITDELAHEWSWEHQSTGLLALYGAVSGLDPQPRAVPWDIEET